MTESITMLQTRMFSEDGHSIQQGEEGMTYLDVRESEARHMYAKDWARPATEAEITHTKLAKAAYAGTNTPYGG